MDDSKIKELQALHRDLAAYLKIQDEAISNGLLAVAAIRTALESNPDLQKAYKASLRDLSEGGTFQVGPNSSTVVLERLLKRLAEW